MVAFPAAGAATSAAKVSLARNIGDCTVQAWSPTFDVGVSLCAGRADEDQEQNVAHGDLLIGIAVVGSAACGRVMACTLYARWKRMSMMQAARVLSPASLLLPVRVAMTPALVGGAYAAVAVQTSVSHPHAAMCALSTIVVDVGLVLGIIPLAFLALMPWVAASMFHIKCVPEPIAAPGAPRPHCLRLLATALMRRRWRWTKENATRTTHMQGNPHVVHNHRLIWTLLLEFNILWYAAMDAGVVYVGSALGAIGSYVSRGPCTVVAGVVVAMLTLQLVLCAVLQPQNRRFDWFVALLTLALTAGSVTLQLASSAVDDDEEHSESLRLGATILEMFAALVCVVQMLVDASSYVVHKVCMPRGKGREKESMRYQDGNINDVCVPMLAKEPHVLCDTDSVESATFCDAELSFSSVAGGPTSCISMDELHPPVVGEATGVANNISSDDLLLAYSQIPLLKEAVDIALEGGEDEIVLLDGTAYAELPLADVGADVATDLLAAYDEVDGDLACDDLLLDMALGESAKHCPRRPFDVHE